MKSQHFGSHDKMTETPLNGVNFLTLETLEASHRDGACKPYRVSLFVCE